MCIMHHQQYIMHHQQYIMHHQQYIEQPPNKNNQPMGSWPRLIFHHHMYSRQLSSRSMFHAGHYLNDKEICYLSTVIVTANVC